MTTQQLTAFSALNRALAAPYAKAAPDLLKWQTEKTFLEAQVRRMVGRVGQDKKVPVILRAVERGVPETIESVKLAARECASMGLSMSPNAQLVYLIPRRARSKESSESWPEFESNVPWIVHIHPGYRGLAYIATHYAGAVDLGAEVVYQADKFRYFGPLKDIEHEPTLVNDQRTERQAIGAYCVVLMNAGHVRAEYVDAPTIQRARALSEMSNGLMWTTFWTEGWRKVPIRRICKTIMVSEPRMLAAMDALDRNEGILIEGEASDVSRGTSEVEPRRGMTGLGAALRRETPPSPEGELDEPEPDPGAEGELADEPVDTQDRKPHDYKIALAHPVDSRHPFGAIEWWADQILAAEELERLDHIRAAALAERVDRGDDADAFRSIYSRRWNELKAEGKQPPTQRLYIDSSRDNEGTNP